MLLPLTLRLLLEDEVAGELRRSQLEVLTDEATAHSGLVSTRSESRPIWSSVNARNKSGVRYLGGVLQEEPTIPWQLTPASRRSGRRLGCPKVSLEVSRERRICTAAGNVCENDEGSCGSHRAYHR